MRKAGLILIGILFCLCLCACSEKNNTKEMEVLDAERELFQYLGTENAMQIAVGDDGTLYTTEHVYIPKEPGTSGYHPHAQKVCAYDLNGNCIETVELRIGNGDAWTFLAENSKLYWIISRSDTMKPSLYEADTTTWETREIYSFSSYDRITDVVLVGDYVYVYGIPEFPEEKEYILHPEVEIYNYNGGVISRINVTEEAPVEERLGLDFPIELFKTAEGLGIYAYTEENGFGIIELNQEKGTLTERCWKNTRTPSQYYISCEDGVLYYNMNGGRIYYGTLDGAEADITGTSIMLYSAPDYIKGFVFYKNELAGGVVERICIADILQENREIKLLMHKDTMDIPYGCGYQMVKNTLGSDAFSLKVLAQDRDFDVYVLSSRNPVSYNLKENGAFYPLNEVEGVQEYLNACFPYLKELATNEEGDIWMIPVALAIPGLEYNKKYCEEQGVDLSAMDFEEFLTFTQEMEKTAPLYTSISYMFLLESFFSQYFQREESFDTELFRNYSGLLKEGYGIEGASWGVVSDQTSVIYAALKEGKDIPDYYYETQYYLSNMMSKSRILQDSDVIGVTDIPSISENVINQGTVTLLAVNPQSENLESALAYISAFAKYMMTKKDSFVLADKSTYTDTPYLRDCYQIYASGGVYFEMDSEVYKSIYWDYLEGDLELEEMIAEAERRRKLYLGE